VRGYVLIKSVLFLFILGAFAALSRHSIVQPDLKSYKNKLGYSVVKKVAASDHNELPKVKRKYKSKGVEVPVPNITVADLQRFYTYKSFSIPKLRSTSAVFLYCAQLKRGPPAV
jgi:hypothetical protein